MSQNETAPIDRAASCMDDYDPESVTVDEARARIAEFPQPTPGVVRVALRSALGRILAEPVRSAMAVPAHRNSAMDGYALAGADLPETGSRTLTLLGKSLAGKPFDGAVSAGECVRITTGAVMPDGADTVVMQEHVRIEGNTVTIDNAHKPGQNVRQAGEDIAPGDVVLQPGQCIHPAELGLLASLGVTEVAVYRPLRVAFFSTGDELRSLGEALDPGCIYDSNRYTLYGMLTELGAEILDMGVVRDDPQALIAAFRAAGTQADVVISSGGVSVGEADYTRDVMSQVGEVALWKVAMKPGRPMAFGRVGDAIFFGLPGNPVSVMVTFYEFVRPALLGFMGQAEEPVPTLEAVTTSRLKKRPGRVEFQRAVLHRNDDDSGWQVSATGDQGSGILRSMSRANCFIVLPMESKGADAGDTVTVQPFGGVCR